MGALHERRLACEMVVSEVYAGILNGDFPSGRPLPAERVLARRFGVDRGTLREGLARLSARGLLWTRAGVGNWVTYEEDIPSAELLVDWFDLSDSLVACRRAATALLDIRSMFLVRAAERVAIRGASESVLGLMDCHLQVMEFHHDRGSLRSTILEAELMFQQRLVEAAGFAFSVGFVPYARFARKYLYCFGLVETCPAVPVVGYLKLLLALHRRQPEAAVAALDGAFDAYDQKVLQVLEKESKLRIAYRRGAGPRVTDWELELDQEEQGKQYSLVGPSNQRSPPWRAPRRDAVHTDSPYFAGAPYPNGPLHAHPRQEPNEAEEMFPEYADSKVEGEEPPPAVPAQPPPPEAAAQDPPTSDAGPEPDSSEPTSGTEKSTSTDEREPDD